MRKSRYNKLILIFTGIISAGCILFLAWPSLKQPLYSPNIILITADALRPDHLGCYGYKRNTTPNLDGFTKNATLFTEAIAHSSHTPISFGSIATGMYFLRHHLRKWGYILNPSLVTLAEVLKKKGYKTIFIANHQHFKALNGFNKGFDVFEARELSSEKIFQSAISYLKEINTKRLFLWIHYMGTHSPYFAPEEYLNVMLKDDFYNPDRRLPIVHDSPESYGFMGIPKSLAQKNNNIENPDFYIAKYDASISFFDSQLSLLFRELKRLRLYDNTIIIITADHGELLGEHGFYFHHGSFVSEPLIKVPLIIKINNSSKRKVIKQQVEASVDIMPTIIDMLKIKTNINFDGTSLFPLMSGRDNSHKQLAIIDEGFFKVAIRSPGFKLIQVDEGPSKSYSLYDLNTDPEESRNLSKARRDIFDLLKKELDEYLKLKSSESAGLIEPMDEDSKQKLRSLGYAE